MTTRAARMPVLGSDGQEHEEIWVGCFLKSCRDGKPRDATPIDMVVVLDVSGSMNRNMECSSSSDVARNRLHVAKDSLKALLKRLRGNDRFGLATFTNVGTVLHNLSLVKERLEKCKN